MKKIKKVLIAGTNSGSGKTTVTSILMSCLANVAPFKVGPDYIDTTYHEIFTGNKSHNLDIFMVGEENMRNIFEIYSQNKDIAVIEGVMGLFDGLSNEFDNFSTAHVARILDIPVILVISAKAISTSCAAIALGFKMLDPRINICGVILNNVSSQRHYLSLKEAIEKYANIECLGYVPKNESLALESRHLGLKLAFEENEKKILQRKKLFCEIGEKYLDLKKIKKIAKNFEPKMTFENWEKIKNLKNKYFGKKVAIAKDRAFSFYYQENLDLLKFCGFEITEFSPIFDKKIPENIDFIYFGGGYPELFAKELQDNISMKKSILEEFEKGTKIYAECGGFMYLAKKIHLLDGENYNFCGILDLEIKMRETLNIKRFGYINIETENGIKLKGHEFHYSEIVKNKENYTFYKICKNDDRKWDCGYRKKNILAGYPHISFFSNLKFFKFLVEEL